MLDMPYFMENPDWFFFDSRTGRFLLTESAPQRAKDSYKAFYDALEKLYGK